MRYGAAAGGAEETHSRHWCPWSKPVNVETWGHVSGPIVMAHALEELRYGIVAHQHERDFKYGHNFAHTLYKILTGLDESFTPSIYFPRFWEACRRNFFELPPTTTTTTTTQT